MFASKSKIKPLLTLVKHSHMPTAFKTKVIDLIKMGCVTKLKNDIEEKIPPKGVTYAMPATPSFRLLHFRLKT